MYSLIILPTIHKFIYLSTHQSTYLSIYLYSHLPIYWHKSIFQSTYPSLSICLPVLLSNCPPTFPSIYPPTCSPAISLPFSSIHTAIFFCLPIHPSLSIPFIHLSVYPHIDPSTCPLIHSPSTYLLFLQFKHLSIHIPIHTYYCTHSPTHLPFLFACLPTQSLLTIHSSICLSFYPYSLHLLILSSTSQAIYLFNFFDPFTHLFSYTLCPPLYPVISPTLLP